jgi:CubicO group peptidase (beta-lactamase class C family)
MTILEEAIQAVEHSLVPSRKPGVRKRDLLERMPHYKVPGFSVVLIDQEEIAWAKAYGLVEAGGEKIVTPETIFQAASISKSVTTLVALRLVEAGLLDLDTDVNEFLRSWKVPRSRHTQPKTDGVRPTVTLRGLLSHTAGMGVRGYPGHPVGTPLPTLLQILDGKPPALEKPVRVIAPPGTEFRYSGGGYLVAQQMIEDVTGRRLADLAHEWIFTKLGMDSSTFEYLLPEVYIPRAATAHRRTGEPVPGKWHLYPEQSAAALWSTPSDLARIIIEVQKSYNDESNLILSAGMVHQMVIPQIGIGGMGFQITRSADRVCFGHPGWNEGFHSLLIGEIGTGRGLVWMANGENGRNLGWDVTRAVADVFEWFWVS